MVTEEVKNWAGEERPAPNGDSRQRGRFSLPGWRSSSQSSVHGERSGDLSRRLLSLVNRYEDQDGSVADLKSKPSEVTVGFDGPTPATGHRTSTASSSGKDMSDASGPGGVRFTAGFEDYDSADQVHEPPQAAELHAAARGQQVLLAHVWKRQRGRGPSRNGSGPLGCGLYIHTVTLGSTGIW
ncbi:hypothetical protein AOLI_G00327720 [Acnodon oligacanthus]